MNWWLSDSPADISGVIELVDQYACKHAPASDKLLAHRPQPLSSRQGSALVASSDSAPTVAAAAVSPRCATTSEGGAELTHYAPSAWESEWASHVGEWASDDI